MLFMHIVSAAGFLVDHQRSKAREQEREGERENEIKRIKPFVLVRKVWSIPSDEACTWLNSSEPRLMAKHLRNRFKFRSSIRASKFNFEEEWK